MMSLYKRNRGKTKNLTQSNSVNQSKFEGGKCETETKNFSGKVSLLNRLKKLHDKKY